VRDGTIAMSMLTDLIRHLEPRGVSRVPILDAAGVTATQLADPDARVSSDAMARAWDAALTLTNDPDFGLHSAETARSGTLGILGYVLLTSATVRDALDAGSRWFSTLNAGVRLVVDARDDELTFAVQPREGYRSALLAHPRQVVETILYGTVRQVEVLTERPVKPKRVLLRHARPASGTREHVRCFGAVVQFGADIDAIVYDAAVGALAIPSALPALRDALAAQADALQASVDTADGVVGRIRHEISRALRGRAPTIQEVGRTLAMSTRSVQRALQEEGTTFQAVLDDVRRQVATATLRRPGVTAAEVGFLLGFAEPASFTRAFRRWTGVPPRDFMRGAHSAAELPAPAGLAGSPPAL
jgi:AraC-like DNA-binding protein